MGPRGWALPGSGGSGGWAGVLETAENLNVYMCGLVFFLLKIVLSESEVTQVLKLCFYGFAFN